jgi:hypothetical protein
MADAFEFLVVLVLSSQGKVGVSNIMHIKVRVGILVEIVPKGAKTVVDPGEGTEGPVPFSISKCGKDPLRTFAGKSSNVKLFLNFHEC